MVRKPKDVTDAELAVLRVLWQMNDATIGQICDAVYGESSESNYATVKKLLARLRSKSYVEQDNSQRPHLFRAVVDEQGLLGMRLGALAEELCSGSSVPLVKHLLENAKFSAKERRELRETIEAILQSKKTD